MGTVFEAPSDGGATGTPLPTERTLVAGLLAGRLRLPPRADPRAVEVADTVDAVRAIITSLRLASVRIVPDSSIPGLHPSGRTHVEVDGATVGVVGEYDADVLRPLGITDPVVGFELDLDAIRDGARTEAIFRPVSMFPPANIDLTFVVGTRTRLPPTLSARYAPRAASWLSRCDSSTCIAPMSSAPTT